MDEGTTYDVWYTDDMGKIRHKTLEYKSTFEGLLRFTNHRTGKQEFIKSSAVERAEEHKDERNEGVRGL